MMLRAANVNESRSGGEIMTPALDAASERERERSCNAPGVRHGMEMGVGSDGDADAMVHLFFGRNKWRSRPTDRSTIARFVVVDRFHSSPHPASPKPSEMGKKEADRGFFR